MDCMDLQRVHDFLSTTIAFYILLSIHPKPNEHTHSKMKSFVKQTHTHTVFQRFDSTNPYIGPTCLLDGVHIDCLWGIVPVICSETTAFDVSFTWLEVLSDTFDTPHSGVKK